MKAQRIFLAALVALGLAVLAGVAQSSMLENEVALDRVSQLVTLKGYSNTGEINFASLSRVMPDGTEVAFTIPADRALLVTKVYFDFKTTSTVTNVYINFPPFPYPATGSNIVNGIASNYQSYPVGFPVGPPQATPYLIKCCIGGTSTTVPGDLTVYLTGMLIPPNAALVPIEYLLLFN